MNVPCYDCDGSGDVDGIVRDADEEESRCSHCSGTGWCSCATCGERYAELTREDMLIDLFPGSGAITGAWETYQPGPTVPDHALDPHE
jgi:DnaJ-class molecular chaperone